MVTRSDEVPTATGAGVTPGGVAPGALSQLLAELITLRDGESAGWSDALAPGERVGRFEIRRLIGRGGFGAVYEAMDPELGRAVALKTLRPGLGNGSRSAGALHQEAEAVARLDHPSIVTLHDVGTSPAGPFLVMELLRGETLAARLRRGPLSVPAALDVAEQMAEALAHAHARGVLHRDLKPSNVFLTEEGRVKLLDFGIAHLLGRADGAGTAGTPGYMSPQHARGEPCDARSDVYAAGVILAEMLPPAPAATPHRLAALIECALAHDPARRPPDGGAWHASLRDVRAALDRRRPRRRALLTALGAALALALTLAAGAMRRPRLAGDPATATATPADVGRAVTRSLTAYEAYLEGTRCRERSLAGCEEHFQRAVAIDPTFAMAHYELAVATFMGPDFAGLGLPALRQAIRFLDRVPANQRSRIRAFAAWAEGREQEAVALFREAVAERPDDFRTASMAALIFDTRDEPAAALEFHRAVFEHAPAPGMGALELVDALGALGREDELAALAPRLEEIARGGGHPAADHALAVARLLLGDGPGALAALRRGVARATTEADRREAIANLWMTRLQLGDLGVEAELRGRCDDEASYQLFTLLALTGRRAEALRVRELGERPECPPLAAGERRAAEQSLFLHASLARFAAGVGDVDRARRHARLALERNPVLAPHLAVYLAWAGDAATAAELARGLSRGSARERAYQAVKLWRRGDRAPARTLLRHLASQNPWSSTPHALPASFLYGALAAELGDDRAAVAALERFRRLYYYRLDFWSWAYPQSLLLLARSYERAGEPERARERIAELLALWERADPDLPLLREARALGLRLGVSRGIAPP